MHATLQVGKKPDGSFRVRGGTGEIYEGREINDQTKRASWTTLWSPVSASLSRGSIF